MIFSVITLFPSFFSGILNESMLKIASENKSLKVNLIDLRHFGEGKHKTVDDRPYGGGRGMILKVNVLDQAIQSARIKNAKNEIVILMDPRGTPFTQKTAQDLSMHDHIILIAGHYEGYDERIRNFIDMEISLGDFILTGGEIPAMAIIDSVTRLVEGAILDREVTSNESFSEENEYLLESPQYTRPSVYKNFSVPDILQSGDHKAINTYRRSQATKITEQYRPDLLKKKET